MRPRAHSCRVCHRLASCDGDRHAHATTVLFRGVCAVGGALLLYVLQPVRDVLQALNALNILSFIGLLLVN